MTGKIRESIAAACIGLALWIVGMGLADSAPVVSDVLTFVGIVCGVLALVALAVSLVRSN